MNHEILNTEQINELLSMGPANEKEKNSADSDKENSEISTNASPTATSPNELEAVLKGISGHDGRITKWINFARFMIIVLVYLLYLYKIFYDVQR